MTNLGNIKHVFAGSNTCRGFYSLFNHILTQHTPKL